MRSTCCLNAAKKQITKLNCLNMYFSLSLSRWYLTYAAWTGMAISSWPKNSFWNPSEPGLMIPATEGVSRPEKEYKISSLTPNLTVKSSKSREKPSYTHHRGNQNQASAEWEAAYNCRRALVCCVKIAVPWPCYWLKRNWESEKGEILKSCIKIYNILIQHEDAKTETNPTVTHQPKVFPFPC